MNRTLKGEEARDGLVNRLQAEHHALDVRLHELEGHLWLSPDEQAEVTRLKKLKLRAKERLFLLRSN